MNSFQALGKHLATPEASYAMVGYELRNTLSEFGTVSRGVCETSPDDYLRRVTELTRIERDGSAACYTDGADVRHRLTGNETVSLNMWGFAPSVFSHLERLFAEFLAARGQEETAEFYIPSAVSQLIDEGRERVKVLRTPDAWFGITYREDRERVVNSIRALIARGQYPTPLWS
jgi:hypothetical protein